MIAPPKTFAAAAVSPSSTLVRMGDMREKDSRKRLRVVSCHQPCVPDICLLEFARALLARTHRLAGLRCLFDDPCVLVHDSSLRGALASAPPLALPDIASGMDGDVGDHGVRNAALAAYFFLFNLVGMVPRRAPVCRRILSLRQVGQEFQRAAIGRAAGSPWRSCTAAIATNVW